MLTRNDVIRKITALGLDPGRYRLATGAALTLYGIRAETRDIDIGCDGALFNELLDRGYSINEEFPHRREILIEDPDGDIEIYCGWAECVPEIIDGIPVMPLADIVRHKQSMGRDKDLRDIALIREYYKTHDLSQKEPSMSMLERFLKYVSFPTNSDEESGSSPSTAKQLKLAEYLADELRGLGLSDVILTKEGYVYATVPANCDCAAPVIGFIAHMDTSSAAADEPIRPKIVEYEGGAILLNDEKDIWMRPEQYPQLPAFKGHRLIVTDGTTLLGADDKAGIAEIVTMAEYLMNTHEPHGTVKIAFTPDEEVGRGTEHFDIPGFGADYAYTVDGGGLGEMEYECFNGASAKVEIEGLSVHPGTAKGIMKNAALYACQFASLLPKHEIPAETEGYEGFFHLVHMEGGIEKALLQYIIRDHDRVRFEERKQQIVAAGEKMNAIYGEGTVKVTVRDSYYNMREEIEKHMYIVDRACDAMRQLGIQPVSVPIRGGTDGASLTRRGLPCPNLCTGGQNYHSRFEFASIDEMEKCTQLLIRIALNAAKL